MSTLRTNLTRLAVIGMLVVPGLVVKSSAITKAASPVTITVAFGENGPPSNYQDLKWWNQIVPTIEAANPDIKIKLEPIVATEGDYYTKIDLMMRSPSTAPDLVKEDSFLIGSDATAGYLTPLNKYLATWPDYKAQWFPGMQAITTFKGVNYGVMNGTDVRGIWYNKHVFAKAGLPTTWQPHNWADILAAARAIKAKVPGVIPINVYSGIPMDEASALQGFQMLLYGTNDPLYDYKTGKWIASSQGFLDSLKFVQAVYDPKNLLGPTNDIALNGLAGNIIQQQLLPKDKMGIDLDGSWVPNTWYPTGAAPWPQWQSVMGMAKMPTEFGQGSGYISMSGGWSYAISSKSTHPDEAFKVMQAANSQANLALFDVLDGQIAVRKDVVTVPAYAKVPMNAFFTSLVAYTQFRAGFPVYPQISNQIQQAMEVVMTQENNPTQAMAGFYAAVKGIAGPNNVEARPAK
jgi:multiple sugar transport system substrate-binding protein